MDDEAHRDWGRGEAAEPWSRGLWVPKRAMVLEMDGEEMRCAVKVARRGKADENYKATICYPARADGCTSCSTADELRDALLRLAVGAGLPESGASLLALPGATDNWSLPDDMWLNTLPNSRSVRSMVYSDVSGAVRAAVADESCSRRMLVTCKPPELNMEFDSYRVGTLLELTRQIAIDLAAAGVKTRVCVQGSMGAGVLAGMPRALSGVRKLLTMMDWEAMPGEANEGLLGTAQQVVPEGEEEVEGAVRFGAVGADQVSEDDEAFIVLAPQSMVGASIHEPLFEMCEAAGDRPVILVNPILKDRPSSSGVMGVRGRKDRIDFADSFQEVYHLRCLYTFSTLMFPILGMIRYSHASSPPGDLPLWILFGREEAVDSSSERYVPLGAFDSEPDSQTIGKMVPKQPKRY